MDYTKEKLMEKVEQDYLNSLKAFGETRLLGTFLVGPGLTTVTVFFPTIGDISINCVPMNSWGYESEDGGNRWVDFRLISDLLCKKKDFISNIFFTEYFTLSSIYQKKFTKMREEVYKTLIYLKLPQVKAEPVLLDYYTESSENKVAEWIAMFATEEEAA
jgi:hypothetical protein